MDFEHYQRFTRSTAIYPADKAVPYLVMGLASEAGEVSGAYKKYLRDNQPYEQLRDNLKKEIGDCYWYLTRLCDELNLNPVEVLEANVAKLTSRKQRNQLTGNGDDR